MLESFGPGLLVLIIVITLLLLAQLKDDGFGSGLLIWLLALITFFFLGYNPDLSILLGAITGIAVGYIISQFKAKDVPIEKDKTQEEQPAEGKKFHQTLFLPWRERVLNRFRRQADSRTRAASRKRRRGITRRR
jgi:cell division protein FtsW (lipid II flippase)